MGAFCCKPSKFEGEGHQLTDVDVASSTQQPTATPVPDANPEAEGDEQDPREAAAEAAEARAEADQSRGTKGGEISKALADQPADGGRVDEAIAAGSQPADEKPIVVPSLLVLSA
ncbi:hypothetical protein KEM48_005103 [Puccinia striiformis f. sp. tritici PST-130]|nr:hypothetical protein KEM48_005103 [Puccinia striiformis f. sp. tritici PST-130]